MPEPPTKRRGLQFTIRQYLGLVAVVTVAGWVARAWRLASEDEDRVARAPSLEFEQFFFCRLQGRKPPWNLHVVAQTLDWHERWDHYVVRALVLAVSAILLALWARRAPRGRPRLGRASVAALLLAGVLGSAADRIVWVNRAYHRTSALRLPNPAQIAKLVERFYELNPVVEHDGSLNYRERLSVKDRVRRDHLRSCWAPLASAAPAPARARGDRR